MVPWLYADAGAGATNPSACLQHPLTPAPFRDARRRRASELRACARCVWCGGARVPAAPRRTGIRAEAIECVGAVAAEEE